MEIGGRRGAVNSPPTGLELCEELCCRQFGFMCDPATAPHVTPKWEGGRIVLSYQVESIPPECTDRRHKCSERPGTGRGEEVIIVSKLNFKNEQEMVWSKDCLFCLKFISKSTRKKSSKR